MNSVVLGLLSAASLGTADFMARFSSRALGAPVTCGAVMLVGAASASAWLLASGTELIWSPFGCALAVANGISVAVTIMLLYAGLARGPIAIVAPIVAAHPALVLAVYVLMGTRPSVLQWGAMLAIVAGGLLVARSAEAHPQFAAGDGKEMRSTVLIAVGACVAYSAIILTGQAASAQVGDLQTTWIGRWTSLAFVGLVLLAQRTPLRIPGPWVTFVCAQGVVDAIGYFALVAGGTTTTPEITTVISSTFSVITVMLAKFVLKEPIIPLQWAAIALIGAGTALLAGNA